MVRLKASTEENLVREKEQNVLFYSKNTRISHGLCDHKTHCAFLVHKHLLQLQWHQQTLRCCDLEPALAVGVGKGRGGDTHLVCEKTEWWSPVLTLILLYIAQVLYYWCSTTYHSFIKTLYCTVMKSSLQSKIIWITLNCNNAVDVLSFVWCVRPQWVFYILIAIHLPSSFPTFCPKDKYVSSCCFCNYIQSSCNSFSWHYPRADKTVKMGDMTWLCTLGGGSEFFPWWYSGQGMKLTTPLQPVSS
jgi:hypothetical protein